ncbi:MAG: NUDIX domain-containing protein [Candidatus Nealsonbacteria bacterium]
MKEIGGIPVVDTKNIFSVLEEKGIVPWPRINCLSMGDYLNLSLSPEKMNVVRKFAPKIEVVILTQPNNGKPFDGFRVVCEDGVIVFTILGDELVLAVADFVHGGEIIRLKPPAGFYKEEEGVPALIRAKDELREETGIRVKDEEIVLLSSEPIYDEPRRLTSKEYYFLARPKPPITILPPKPDSTEIIQPFLMPFNEWLKAIRLGIITDSSAITATMLYFLKKRKA